MASNVCLGVDAKGVNDELPFCCWMFASCGAVANADSDDGLTGGVRGSFAKGGAQVTLPDWTTALNTQMTNWLGWSTLQLIVTVVIGAAVILIIAGMLLRIFVFR